MTPEIARAWSGRITIANPVGLINEIAARYETIERVIMEYIDNSLDDADDMAKQNKGKYPYHIKISVTIDKELKQVTIRDNCRGMDYDTLSRIVHKIGESKKRACPWLNGRFGFGVHAFRGFCQDIIFRTKHKADKHYVLKLYKDSLEVRPPRVEEDSFRSNSGTGVAVTLQRFQEDVFETLTAEGIREEIEAHFETMLRKGDVTIEVGYKGLAFLVCSPYDYKFVPGKAFTQKEMVNYDGKEYPIDIFLKVSDVPISRRPRFFAKGRRVLDIKDDKSFLNKSKYRTAVWDHSNLTGFIEVGDLVQPVITRDGFDRGKNRTLLHEAILKWEEAIKEKVDEINKRYEDNSLDKIEDVISKALTKLSREDALRLRSELVVGNGGIPLSTGGGSGIVDGVGGPSGGDSGGGGGGGSGDGTGIGPEGKGEGAFQGEGEGGPLPEEGVSDYQGLRRKKAGIAIKFRNIPPDVDGKVFRSQFNGGIIVINKDHLDFKDRIKRTHQGELKVNHRLISYIAAVISIHYKDQYYEKFKNQPEVRTVLFDEQVEFIFRLESTLIPFLKEIENIIYEDADA